MSVKGPWRSGWRRNLRSKEVGGGDLVSDRAKLTIQPFYPFSVPVVKLFGAVER